MRGVRGRLLPWLLSLRRPEAGIAGQGARFALAGATVMAVYVGSTTLLSSIVGLPFQYALAIGYCAGLVVHFTLQRRFVWAHGENFALGLRGQATRYLVAAAAQYGVTAASTALLPAALGLPTEAVYLATVAVVVSTNFLVFRHGIFHAR